MTLALSIRQPWASLILFAEKTLKTVIGAQRQEAQS